MIVIFDLDYTLLDTESFKKGLAKASNISLEDFERIYIKYFSHDTGRKFTLAAHLRFLIKEKLVSREDKEKIKLATSNEIKKINKYLFPESEDLLKKFKAKNHYLILLTWGNKKWQKSKIDNLKIKKYFDEIITVDKDKGDCIKFLEKKHEKILVINDNLKESLKLVNKLKNSELFLIKSRYSRNHENLLPEHKLKDSLTLIK